MEKINSSQALLACLKDLEFQLLELCHLKEVSSYSALYAFLHSALCDVKLAQVHIDEFDIESRKCFYE